MNNVKNDILVLFKNNPYSEFSTTDIVNQIYKEKTKE